MARTSSWTQNLIKGENHMEKRERKSYRTARTHARTFHSVSGMYFMHTIT